MTLDNMKMVTMQYDINTSFRLRVLKSIRSHMYALDALDLDQIWDDFQEPEMTEFNRVMTSAVIARIKSRAVGESETI